MELLTVIGWIVAAFIGWSLDRWGLFSLLAAAFRRHLPAFGNASGGHKNVRACQSNDRRLRVTTFSKHGLLGRPNSPLPIQRALMRVLFRKGLVPILIGAGKTRRGTS